MKQVLGLLIVTFAALTADASTQVVGVRKGDTIPLEIMMSGDFVETEQPALISLKAKKNLWLRFSANQVEVSLDGTNFIPFTDVATGSLEVGSLNSSSMTAHLKIISK